MVLGVLIAVGAMIGIAALVVELQFGFQESMLFLPLVNSFFLMGHVIPWYVVHPSGVMVVQGYIVGAGPILPETVTVVSALQYALAGLAVTVAVPLVAGYYFFRRAEVKG